MKLNNPSLAGVKQLEIKIGQYPIQPTAANPAAPAGYSDAYKRDGFFRTSFHLKPGPESDPTDTNFTVQVSNIPFPDETTDADWVSLTSTFTGYVCTDLLFHWFRIKGVNPGDMVYVYSFDPKFA